MGSGLILACGGKRSAKGRRGISLCRGTEARGRIHFLAATSGVFSNFLNGCRSPKP